MSLFKKLNLATSTTIDWEMTPDYTFGTFESWGGKERIRSSRERCYYFFIDNWGTTPRLLLMERGVKHAKILAEISAPPAMVRHCVEQQGKTVFEKNLPINEELKAWLISNVLETDDDSKITPIQEEAGEEPVTIDLPRRSQALPTLTKTNLPASAEELSEEQVAELIRTYDLLDFKLNAQGKFHGYLVDNEDELTVSDLVTGLKWQREGLTIMSHRMLDNEIQTLNHEGFAGFHDWRLPSIAEALSLLVPEKNSKGLYLHPCYSANQPFIFTNATRRPGGYWFIDYKQGLTFWASGTIPGGFGRLCRTEK